MSIDPILRRLAAADPAATAVASPTADEIEGVKHRPVPDAVVLPARRRLRYAVIPTVGLAVMGLVVVVVVSSGPAPQLDLTAAAYAQTGPVRGRIAHTLVTAVTTETTDGRVTRRERSRQESWIYGPEVHYVQSIFPAGRKPLVADDIVGADGVMRHLDGFSNYRIVRPSDNQDSADVIARQRNGFVAEFRKSYEQGVLDPAGDTEYAGRPARRYVVQESRNGPPGIEQSYFLDRRTGSPLGMVSVAKQTLVGEKNSGPFVRGRAVVIRYELTVRKIGTLPVTAANLRDLRTPVVVRRRDSNGCIRGAVEKARTADSARRYDCGGTPGGPVSEP